MKVTLCIVAPLPPPYGGISHWATLVSQGADGNANVEISILDTAPRWRSIHNRSLFDRAIGGAFQLVRDISRLFYKLVSARYTVLHLTTSGSVALVRDVLVAIIARIFRIPLVYHLHFGRVPDISKKSSMEWQLLFFVMTMADRVIAIDLLTYSAISNSSSHIAVELVPNCVDIAALPVPTSSEGMLTAVFLGWVVESKGVEELLEAWCNIQQDGWRLKIVGPCDGHYREFLSRKFASTTIDFIGELPHSEAMKLLACCDLFVLPSHTEGFPNVVLEAMALRKPIVATNVGAIPEMLSEGCGTLVEVKDVAALQKAIEALMHDSLLREKMGETAFDRANTYYSLGVVFDKYWNIWANCAR